MFLLSKDLKSYLRFHSVILACPESFIVPLWKRGMKGNFKNKCFHYNLENLPFPSLPKRGIFGSIPETPKMAGVNIFSEGVL
jgi:hypothetical protein